MSLMLLEYWNFTFFVQDIYFKHYPTTQLQTASTCEGIGNKKAGVLGDHIYSIS